MIPKLYKTEHVLDICPGMTRRKLDYWVETNVITPSYVLETNENQRKYYLFTFDDIVRIRIVEDLRQAGVALGAIRSVVDHLRELEGPQWQRAWLVTDGRTLYEVTQDPRIVKSFAKGERGQLAFAMVAVGDTIQNTNVLLEGCEPVDRSRFDAILQTWAQSSPRRKATANG